jgi:DNA repair protein RadC
MLKGQARTGQGRSMHPENVKAQSDADLFATRLRCRTPGEDHLLAKWLLERFGGPRALLHADCRPVRQVRGVGQLGPARVVRDYVSGFPG